MDRLPAHDLSSRAHSHVFDEGNAAGERRTWIVVGITAVMMVAEIIGGWITGSMALLADGWHMGTHVAALSLSGIAYALARRWAGDGRFAFGTWKIEVLGAFSSALILGMVAIAVLVESVTRLLRPEAIDFAPALAVAVAGLAVNLLSAFILGGKGHGHGHGHEHGHEQEQEHGHEHEQEHEHGHEKEHEQEHGHPHEARHGDLNLRSAYVHVLADAFTSVVAIVALLGGMLAGWNWLDPAMGVVGALVIAWWAKGLLTESARVLLDREMDSPLVAEVRSAIESDGDARVADLHLWRVGRARYATVVSIVADRPLEPDAYRARLAGMGQLAHVTIEVNLCRAGATGPCS